MFFTWKFSNFLIPRYGLGCVSLGSKIFVVWVWHTLLGHYFVCFGKFDTGFWVVNWVFKAILGAKNRALFSHSDEKIDFNLS
jgi:hypothetical protein